MALGVSKNRVNRYTVDSLQPIRHRPVSGSCHRPFSDPPVTVGLPFLRLIEENFNGLVGELAFPQLFGKTFQPEEPGRIALVDGDLEITRTVEQGQFFAFGYVGIALADPVDDLISFENDPEPAALSLFLELFAGDIDDHVFEIVDKDDLSFDHVVVECGAEMSFFGIDWIGVADIFDGFAVDQLVDHPAHDRSKVNSVLDGVFIQRDTDHDFGCFFKDHGDQPVVGAEQVLVVVKGEQQLIGFFLKQVDQDEVIGKSGEILYGRAAHVGRLRVVERRNIMGDIDYGKTGVHLQQLRLNRPHEVIGVANVGGEGE